MNSTEPSQTDPSAAPSPFDWFGASLEARQSGVRRLVDLFYDEMDQNPEFKRIRDLHPRDLSDSREKFYLFLVGWMGGPDLYQPRFGHPRLRARHMPFPIASEDRNQWLACMLAALRTMQFSEDQIQQLMLSFFKTADWMRNRPDDNAVEGLRQIQVRSKDPDSRGGS